MDCAAALAASSCQQKRHTCDPGRNLDNQANDGKSCRSCKTMSAKHIAEMSGIDLKQVARSPGSLVVDLEEARVSDNVTYSQG